MFRSEAHSTLLCEPEELIALASDIPWDIGVPCYHIDDVDGVVGEILSFMEKSKEK